MGERRGCEGAAVELPDQAPTPTGVKVCPSVRGASNWMSTSYNPDTQLLYVPTLEQCGNVVTSTKMPEPGKFYMRAINPKTGARRWEYRVTGPATMWAGAVSTGGGVLFFGDDDGQLVALDAKTGKHLWHYNMGQKLTASPMTFSLDGKQYVSIASATDVLTFGLFEAAVSVPVVKESVTP